MEADFPRPHPRGVPSGEVLPEVLRGLRQAGHCPGRQGRRCYDVRAGDDHERADCRDR